MASRIGTCRQHAADCDRHAVLSADGNIRRQYLDLAKQWRDMAEQLEAMEQFQRPVKIK